MAIVDFVADFSDTCHILGGYGVAFEVSVKRFMMPYKQGLLMCCTGGIFGWFLKGFKLTRKGEKEEL